MKEPEDIQIIEYSSFDCDPSRIQEFLHKNRNPVIIRGVYIGPCLEKWTSKYLKEVNPEKKVKIHRSREHQLDFINRNFRYETIGFSELIDKCADADSVNDYLYLRSLGEDPRGKDISDLSKHFPELSKDIQIPQFFPQESFFSSVFRISSPRLQLWTHYDTCDNILIQIKGRKRLVLYPPSEALNLYMIGDKSAVLDIDSPQKDKFPKFYEANRIETFLEEGEILFIPSLCFHNVTAMDFTISVNVFWKNLSLELYDKKDTYGNRELIPAQLAFKTFEKATHQLKTLPSEYEDFYLRQMITLIERRLDELQIKKPPET